MRDCSVEDESVSSGLRGAVAAGAFKASIAVGKHAAASPTAIYICPLYDVPKATRAECSVSPESIPNLSVFSKRSAAIDGDRIARILGSRDLFVIVVPIETPINPPSVRNCD